MAPVMLLLLSLSLVLPMVRGHGYLMDPPGRASMWRYGYRTPINYNDNQMSCGGAYIENTVNGGKCGICGDPWNARRENEGGGRFATGIISKTYREGQVIFVHVKITANHMGWFEFKLCPNNNPNRAATPECLDAHPLEQANGRGTKYYISSRTGVFSMRLALPPGLICTQCVLQWHWHTGNSWGVNPNGRACVGCGMQEEFYGCADIAIVGDGHRPVVPETHSVTQRPHVYAATTRRSVPHFQTHRTYTPPRRTEKPASTSTEKQTPTKKTQPKERAGCIGVNNWAGIPSLDRWCRLSCGQGNCPPIYCRCS